MAVSRRKKKKNSIFAGLKEEIISIILIGLAIFMWWNIFYPPDGKFGLAVNKFMVITFGSLAGLFPMILCYIAFSRLLKMYWQQPRGRVEAILLLFITFLVGAHLFLPLEAEIGTVPWEQVFYLASEGLGGGYVGAFLTGAFWWAFGKKGSFIFLTLIGLISLLGIGQRPLLDRIYLGIRWIFSPKKKRVPQKSRKKVKPTKKRTEAENSSKKQEETSSSNITLPDLSQAVSPETGAKAKSVTGTRPTLDLLNDPKNNGKEHQEDRSNLLADTLASFGVEASIAGYVCGPTLTRYEVIPGTGVKVKQIENLADDLALALAAPSVRIEAPIPGKRAVGIEVPHESPGTVYLKEVLAVNRFTEGASPLLIGVGKDIAGQSVVADMKKLIHLLIAGSTGSGKSVCINSILASLLLKASPEELRLLLIDPKRVELALYEGVPHLLTPVVTDPREAAKALRWAVMEMEERYLAFEEARVRDLPSYNEKALHNGKEVLPYIIIIIDELADLMMVASAEVEEAICRLAQKARAAGMHLIVATQRPSTDVVTGLIKANIPSRIAFAVASGTDSSIILDTRGAEKLLGKGDMLFYPIGIPKPARLQGAFISDQEVERLVSYWREQGGPDYVDLKVEAEAAAKAADAKDDLLPQAAKIVVDNDRASASFLQRHLRIGYTRAARLIDIMETLGIVGSYQGSKPRDVLVTSAELEEILKDY